MSHDNILAQDVKYDSLSLNYSIVDTARNYLGINYKYSGKNPETGFDCSGFTGYVFSKFDYKLPHTSSSFANIGIEVKKESALPGDIILFNNRRNTKIGHVGIITDNKDNEILFIHASTSSGVVISKLSIPYYKKRYVQIRRIID